MNTQEKLTAIRDKCVELLAIAEKRTQGKWSVEQYTNYHGFSVWGSGCCIAERWYKDAVSEECAQDLAGDAAYIASCAGPAEAGWRSTIAAIDICLDYDLGALEIMAIEIIGAWEGIV